MLKNGKAKMRWRASGEAVELSVASMNASAGIAMTQAMRTTTSRRRRHRENRTDQSAGATPGIDQAWWPALKSPDTHQK